MKRVELLLEFECSDNIMFETVAIYTAIGIIVGLSQVAMHRFSLREWAEERSLMFCS